MERLTLIWTRPDGKEAVKLCWTDATPEEDKMMANTRNVYGNGIGLYGQFVKALKAGKIQPWQRDAFSPSARDLELWATQVHTEVTLTGTLEDDEREEIEAEAENAESQEVEA